VCGYLGYISTKKIETNHLLKCNKLIECRGPDNLKIEEFSDNYLEYQLIFNRLSILDLTPEANQPMFNENQSISVMFNGEIYNHKSLRNYLEKKEIFFKTSHSDTEVVLKGLENEGLDFIKKLEGQFAITFIDKNKKKIYLIRDRVGQKPLFYSINKQFLAFGSNLKSVANMLQIFELDKDAINEYFELGVVTAPRTILKNIYKVNPGEYLEIHFNNDSFKVNKDFYWQPQEFLSNDEFKIDEFMEIYSESISKRINADVPIANYLSGGIDSSSIIKNLYDNGHSVNTFNVGFESKKYDESYWANEVAQRYRTNHQEVKISSDISIKDIISSIMSLDEPYADPSVVPSFKIANLISQQYKVAISGDGGDELLGGYTRISNSLNNNKKFSTIYKTLYKLQPSFIGTGASLLSKVKNFNISYSASLFDEKLVSYLNISSNKENFQNDLIKVSDSSYKNMIFAEYKLYLPEMMMLKVDRTSMANSLEVRSPFVDNKLIEYILAHDSSYYDYKNPKKILKDYLLQDFSEQFITRPKMGFVFDLEYWVYSNFNFIKEIIESGDIVLNLNKNYLRDFKIVKSRINANRIWKAFVLEYFVKNLKV